MIKQHTLSNGIRVVMEKMAGVDSVAIGIWTKTGAVNEPAEYAGISHYIEHMMFKGTEKRTALQIAEDADRIGAQINAFTGKEATCYHIRTLSSNAEAAIEILLDMFTGSVFDEKEMNRERKVIKEEIKMIADTPDEDAQDLICEQVFRGNPAGNSIIGTPGTLNRIDRKTILNYRRTQYSRDSIVVALAGHFQEEKVLEQLERGLMAPRARKKKPNYRRHDYTPVTKVKVKDIEQSHLCLGVPTIGLADPRYYALNLLSNIMGGSMSSWLFQNVREQKGLAYSVYSMNSALSQCGFFNIYAGISHGNVARVIDAIAEELDYLRTNGVEAEELDKAKEQLKSSYIFGQETVNGRMFATGKRMTLLDEVQTGKDIIAAIDRVRLEDIEEVGDMIADLSRYSGVLISDRRQPLKKYIRDAIR